MTYHRMMYIYHNDRAIYEIIENKMYLEIIRNCTIELDEAVKLTTVVSDYIHYLLSLHSLELTIDTIITNVSKISHAAATDDQRQLKHRNLRISATRSVCLGSVRGWIFVDNGWHVNHWFLHNLLLIAKRGRRARVKIGTTDTLCTKDYTTFWYTSGLSFLRSRASWVEINGQDAEFYYWQKSSLQRCANLPSYFIQCGDYYVLQPPLLINGGNMTNLVNVCNYCAQTLALESEERVNTVHSYWEQ